MISKSNKETNNIRLSDYYRENYNNVNYSQRLIIIVLIFQKILHHRNFNIISEDKKYRENYDQEKYHENYDKEKYNENYYDNKLNIMKTMKINRNIIKTHLRINIVKIMKIKKNYDLFRCI